MALGLEIIRCQLKQQSQKNVACLFLPTILAAISLKALQF